jgi:hypothetical protein
MRPPEIQINYNEFLEWVLMHDSDEIIGGSPHEPICAFRMYMASMIFVQKISFSLQPKAKGSYFIRHVEGNELDCYGRIKTICYLMELEPWVIAAMRKIEYVLKKGLTESKRYVSAREVLEILESTEDLNA